MNKLCSISVILAMLAGLLPAGVFAADPDEDDSQAEAVAQPALPASAWPVKFEANGSSYVVYQPQFDKWENNRIEGRSAVAVTAAGAESPEFGVAWLAAQTETSAGSVTIRDLSVTKADFPTDSGGSGDHVAAMRQQLGAKSWQVAQERLLNDLEIDKVASKSAAQPVKNDVPQIIFSQQAAILVPIDGAPVMREVPGTSLKRIVNTRALMLFDPVLTNYYLYVSDHWMEAQKFEGPWSRVANPPAQLEQAKEAALKGNQVDLLAADEDEDPVPNNPAIYVSTTPTELLQTEGAPQYSPVENTRLLYVTNSPNRIFLDTATQVHYVLISGRWFRARNLGPNSWEYVSAASLPGDFARIPSTHPTENVRAAVAGTPQAREAAIENTVPQVATVTRSAATLGVTYDGDPAFQPIEGTSLQQAVNAPVPVIRVSENAFYALDNGVWFVATSPFGPWTAAASVPAVIYSIPRSSPLHYVTYVRIYDATPEVVYVGYTPGYVGSYVSSDYVVVYGTGWAYRPWIGSVWYGAPVTWGFGFSYVHTWWYPWRPYYAHWAPAPWCFRPAWGPWHYRPVHHRAGTTVVNNVTINRVNVRQANVTNIYNRWDRKSVAVNRAVQPRVQQAGAPGQGRGHITRPDGSRQNLGDGRARHDSPDRDRTAQRRSDGNPSPVRMPNRRTDDDGRPARPDTVQSHNELPQIQGPNRRWHRDPNGNLERGGSSNQGRETAAAPRQQPQAGVQPRPGEGNRPDRPQSGNQQRRDVVEPDGRQVVRPNDRDDANRNNANTGRLNTMPDRRETTAAPQQQPQAGVQQRPGEGSRPDRPQFGNQQRRDVVQPDGRQAVRPNDRDDVNRNNTGRLDTMPDRREIARPQRRDVTSQDRRNFSRQQRPDFSARPQGQAAPQVQAMPRAQAPQVQAMPRPQAIPRTQAMPQRLPESRAAAPQSQPRMERNMEGRAARSEGGGRPRAEGAGGQRQFGGGNFRPEAR